MTYEECEEFLFEWVRPRAEAIDQDVIAVREAVAEMASRGLMSLRVPVEFGGQGWDDKTFRRFQETFARCSGSLAFLQTQHQSACKFLAGSENASLRESLFPKLATGEALAGIAFSQLRRPGKPMLVATATDDGYILNGKAPWITGWGIFDLCVMAGTLETSESVWGMVSLSDSAITPSPIMHLASMESVQTVSVEVHELFVPRSDVLYIRPRDWIHHSDMLNIALQSPFALGCAQAGIDIVRSAFEKKPLDEICSAADVLQAELDSCRAEAWAAMENSDNAARSLKSRAWAIEMAGRCAHAAVVASSGAGNSMLHPAQRVYREAIVFSVSAQTDAILSATLAKLARLDEELASNE